PRRDPDSPEGSSYFSAPPQLFALETTGCVYGWGLCIHPDLIRGTSLGQKINTYNFFSYEVNEALHVSEEEKEILTQIVFNLQAELQRAIDQHSKFVLSSGVELLLNHCMRFYDR
ncbi:MAG: AraC family transcriptional regulator, partial [Bacteroidota bacterium]